MESKTESCWWLNTVNLGTPVFIEIIEINGEKVKNTEKPPVICMNDTLTVDRAFGMQLQHTERGPVQSIFDARQLLGIVAAQDDITHKESRRPLYYKASSLFDGPYLWLNIDAAGEAQLRDIVKEVYTPKDERILMPNKNILTPSEFCGNPDPKSAMEALRNLKKH